MVRSQFIRYWLPVLLWMGVIFTASTDLMSTERTSRFIGPLLLWLHPEISQETIRQAQFAVRKTAHVAEYGILALLVWRLRRGVRGGKAWDRSDAIVAIAACAAFAGLDELHQWFVPTRHGSVWDVLLDTAGAALAMGSLWMIGHWKKWW